MGLNEDNHQKDEETDAEKGEAIINSPRTPISCCHDERHTRRNRSSWRLIVLALQRQRPFLRTGSSRQIYLRASLAQLVLKLKLGSMSTPAHYPFKQ